MTPELLERDWLSLRYWLQRCVLPTSLILLTVLLALKWISPTIKDLNHSALIVGFFALYFILVRGGHIVMIRSMHFDLKRKYESLYREKLGQISGAQLRRRNIGFTLARIKRDIINTTKG